MPFNLSLAAMLLALLASSNLLPDRSRFHASLPLGAAASPADSSLTRYDSTLFVPNPPGCDAYLFGAADGHTYWGGCNTNGCDIGVDCSTVDFGRQYWCACEDGIPTTAKCWAAVTFGADGVTVTGVDCQPNGCPNDCDIWLYWTGNFYPCNC